jgi:hypothetical protein
MVTQQRRATASLKTELKLPAFAQAKLPFTSRNKAAEPTGDFDGFIPQPCYQTLSKMQSSQKLLVDRLRSPLLPTRCVVPIHGDNSGSATPLIMLQ